MTVETVTALIVALFSGGGIVAIINVFANRKKAKMDVTQASIDLATDVVESVSIRLEAMSKDLAMYRSELEFLRQYLKACQILLCEHNIAYPTEAEFRNTL